MLRSRYGRSLFSWSGFTMKFSMRPGYTPAMRMLAAAHSTIAPPSTQSVRANAFARTLWVLGGAIVLWAAASILIAGVYPGLIENFIVKPDQLNKERPYLERNIAATRAAYRLDNVDETLFNVSDTPSATEARR